MGDALLEDPDRAHAFGITDENWEAVLFDRLHLLRASYPNYQHLCQEQLQIPPDLTPLWELWIPLAVGLHQRRQALDRPLVQGILGGQGTGKTTMGAVLALLLSHLGYPTLSLSLDDLYKPYVERQRLQEQDPRLLWRGPPGTHEVSLGIEVLGQLRRGNTPVSVPRFDKSAHQGQGDRTQSETVQDIQVVLFEGWFVGMRPIDPHCFDDPPDPITTEADRTFARDMNDRLREYLPLWDCLDHLWVLTPVDYRLSQQWRRRAEQHRIARGGAGMTEGEVDRFVEYFWKALHPTLFLPPLLKTPGAVDLAIEIQADHTPGKVYRPA
ncbi:MAG: glycerate kinase [Leptolyngbyaceae cyanobacterium bins.59]|nr:glycerate kinase [Leptolyngbyaceae cyanobacterium bins.59]